MRLKIIHFRMIAEFVFRRLERRCPTLHGFGRNVPAEVRQKLTGHADDATHQKYTHLELQPLEAAIAKLPSVFNS